MTTLYFSNVRGQFAPNVDYRTMVCFDDCEGGSYTISGLERRLEQLAQDRADRGWGHADAIVAEIYQTLSKLNDQTEHYPMQKAVLSYIGFRVILKTLRDFEMFRAALLLTGIDSCVSIAALEGLDRFHNSQNYFGENYHARFYPTRDPSNSNEVIVDLEGYVRACIEELTAE